MVFSLDSADRLQFVPPHKGPNVLPSFMLFTRMVRHAHKRKLIAIKDLTFGYEVSIFHYDMMSSTADHGRPVMRRS